MRRARIGEAGGTKGATERMPLPSRVLPARGAVRSSADPTIWLHTGRRILSFS